MPYTCRKGEKSRLGHFILLAWALVSKNTPIHTLSLKVTQLWRFIQKQVKACEAQQEKQLYSLTSIWNEEPTRGGGKRRAQVGFDQHATSLKGEAVTFVPNLIESEATDMASLTLGI